MSDVWTEHEVRLLMEELIPFNRFLGMKVGVVDDSGVRLVLPFRDEFVGDPVRRALHGGLLSTLIDTAGGLAAFLGLEKSQRVSTVDLVVDYLRPGPPEDIEACARVVRRGNRVCISTVEVRPASGGEPFAQGRGVYNITRVA